MLSSIAHGEQAMQDRPLALGRVLLDQFDIAWALTRHHLTGLSTEECLWRPTGYGPHVHAEPSGRWRADWPEQEHYAIGLPSIAWMTWHVCFWWRKALDHLDGDVSLTPRDVSWPGTAEGVVADIEALQGRWRSVLIGRGEAGLHRVIASSWPMPKVGLGTLAAWLNLELMKSAAEIGQLRFMHGSGRAEPDRQFIAEGLQGRKAT